MVFSAVLRLCDSFLYIKTCVFHRHTQSFDAARQIAVFERRSNPPGSSSSAFPCAPADDYITYHGLTYCRGHLIFPSTPLTCSLMSQSRLVCHSHCALIKVLVGLFLEADLSENDSHVKLPRWISSKAGETCSTNKMRHTHSSWLLLWLSLRPFRLF